MKHLFLYITLCYSFPTKGQELKEFFPIEVRGITTFFSDDFIMKFNSGESLKTCELIWEKMSNCKMQYEDLSAAEKASLTYCDDLGGNPWSKPFLGCSWYCGGKIEKITSSNPGLTELVHDADYGKPWISSNAITKVNYLLFSFDSESASIRDIVIINGHVKSKELFNSYSRVKRLKMYINDQPYGILNLEDIDDEQVFRFDPIGNGKGKYPGLKTGRKDWTIKLEILERYDGESSMIAIAEIYFDGDGHE